jgi:nitrite reductase/ring-hydroxylating ferredoxin subunit
VGAVATLSALPDDRDVILGTRDAAGLPVDVVLRRSGDAVRAFDARCTHAGCIVAVDGTDLLCRCHGSVFDGATGARVGGPAPSGLLALPVRISGGQVFVTVT